MDAREAAHVEGRWGARWRQYGVPLLLYALLALAWMVVIPPWQGPDEPGHYEYTQLLADLGRPPQRRDERPDLQAAIIRELDRQDFWRFTREPRPQPLPTRFAAHPFLRRSGSQLGDEPPYYYVLPALLTPLVPDMTAHLLWARLYSLLLGVGVVLAAAWGAPRAWPRRPLLARGLPYVVALLPMPAFAHAMFNPGVLADVVGAWFFAVAWALLRASRPRQARGYWVALAGITFLALVVKRTTAILLPLALGVLWAAPTSPLRRARRGVAYVALALVLALVLFPRVPDRAAAWREGPARVPARRVPGQGIAGSAALLLRDVSPARRVYLAQNVAAHRVPALWGEWVRFRVAVRAATGQPWVCMSVIDRASRSVACARATSSWQVLSVDHVVHPGTSFVRAVVGIGNPHEPRAVGTAFVDALHLVAVAGPNVLDNGDAEEALLRVAPWWDRLLRLGHLGPPEVYAPTAAALPLPARLFLALAILFVSFWGNYGWLQYPLPVPVYVGLGLVTLGLVVGMARSGATRGGAARRIFRFNVAAVLLAFVAMLAPVLRPGWFPQARYLFPLLLPLVALGLEGVRAWFPRVAEPRLLRWTVAAVAAFALFSLVWTAYQFYG